MSHSNMRLSAKHKYALFKKNCRLNRKLFFFSSQSDNPRNLLPRSAVCSPSLAMFKSLFEISCITFWVFSQILLTELYVPVLATHH